MHIDIGMIQDDVELRALQPCPQSIFKGGKYYECGVILRTPRKDNYSRRGREVDRVVRRAGAVHVGYSRCKSK